MIHLLSEQTINQIAAGEVIENSASVVKELVENSLDAGASSIKVETRGGGRSLISVSDNGMGMNQDDLCLAIKRHATSKIQNVNDLNSLCSLGFRGEALPSIASVSKMKLISSTGDLGSELEVVGGKLSTPRPLARCCGTTIEVRSLFFNVPVRKKFQKSIASDVAAIHKYLTKVALCKPQLHLVWIHEGKMEFELTKDASLLDRIRILLGREFADNLIEAEGLGYLCKPSFHRGNRTGQYLAINQRPLNSPFVSQKILEAYATRLPKGRFAQFVLDLSLPPDWIDVNVHPQKSEVRFVAQDEIAKKLITGVEVALKGRSKPLCEVRFIDEPSVCSVAEEIVPYVIEQKEDEEILFVPPKEVLAIWEDFILTQENDGLRLHDVKAISYAIEFENLEKNQVEQQTLLFPHTIEVSGAEKIFLMEHLERLNELGIAIRHFGATTFVVDALPVFLEIEQISSLITDLVENGEINFVKTLARKSKVRVSSREQAAKFLERCGDRQEGVDGSSLFITLSEHEVRKRFESNRSSSK